MVSVAGRWLCSTQDAEPRPFGGPQPRLCRARRRPGARLRATLPAAERPYSAAEIRAAAPPTRVGPDAGQHPACRPAPRLQGRQVKADRAPWPRCRRPFLIIGRRPGEGWLARARVGDHLVLVDPGQRRESLVSLETVADLADAGPAAQAAAATARQRQWRDPIMHRLRPVLWELGIASVVINLMALATPLFLMTVYNKVINHNALHTLDVLALGMITLFVFEWGLRSLRGYIASHTGGRLDAALGSEVVHHLMHLPLRSFEKMPTGQILERTRQLDNVRQFFTSQMPLLLVDLAFVGLVRRGAALSGRPAGRDRAGRDAVLLAAVAAGQAPAARAGRGGLPGGRGQGVEPRRGGQPCAHGQGARPRARDGAALQGEARAKRLDRLSRQQSRRPDQQLGPGPAAPHRAR